jgi:hypothetical protein
VAIFLLTLFLMIRKPRGINLGLAAASARALNSLFESTFTSQK